MGTLCSLRTVSLGHCSLRFGINIHACSPVTVEISSTAGQIILASSSSSKLYGWLFSRNDCSSVGDGSSDGLRQAILIS